VSAFDHFRRGVGESTRTNGLAYGYSVVITSVFGVVHAEIGGPTVWEAVLFGAGTSVTFSILAAVVTRGFTRRVEREAPVVLALAVALSVLSVTASIGAAALDAWVTWGWLAWFTAPLVASAVYILVSGVETMLARGVHAVVGTDEIEER
jgi:hypothetical protein